MFHLSPMSLMLRWLFIKLVRFCWFECNTTNSNMLVSVLFIISRMTLQYTNILKEAKKKTKRTIKLYLLSTMYHVVPLPSPQIWLICQGHRCRMAGDAPTCWWLRACQRQREVIHTHWSPVTGDSALSMAYCLPIYLWGQTISLTTKPPGSHTSTTIQWWFT